MQTQGKATSTVYHHTLIIANVMAYGRHIALCLYRCISSQNE